MNIITIKKYFITLSSILSILLGAYVPSVTAEEVIVTGNNAGSENTVNVTQSNTTTVTQSNDAVITNNISSEANTGDNTATNNTGGETNISTGDINTSVSVVNSGNVSMAEVGPCDCPSTDKSIITENAAGSINTINNTEFNYTSVSVTQTAIVTNNVVTASNTGNNTADFNNGDVSIRTGNIRAAIGVLNGPLNISKVKVSSGGDVEHLLRIAGNGVSSMNAINNVEINGIVISADNIASIINNITEALNTGGNSANYNNGDVAIQTGDIWSEIKVKNLANVNEVIIDCGCKPKPGENPPPILPPGVTTTPPSPTGGGGPGSSPSSSSGVGGEVAIAAALGAMLPVTGTNWLVVALIGNVLMLFLGAYLRLRSGRSPGFAAAF
jgi:hypothetical protein